MPAGSLDANKILLWVCSINSQSELHFLYVFSVLFMFPQRSDFVFYLNFQDCSCHKNIRCKEGAGSCRGMSGGAAGGAPGLAPSSNPAPPRPRAGGRDEGARTSSRRESSRLTAASAALGGAPSRASTCCCRQASNRAATPAAASSASQRCATLRPAGAASRAPGRPCSFEAQSAIVVR